MKYRCYWCDGLVDDDCEPSIIVEGLSNPVEFCPVCFDNISCAHCGNHFDEDFEIVMYSSISPMHKDCVPYANAELAADAAYERWRDER